MTKRFICLLVAVTAASAMPLFAQEEPTGGGGGNADLEQEDLPAEACARL